MPTTSAADRALFDFNIGTPERPARLSFDPTTNKATIDARARGLVRAKMPILGYAMTGWGPSRGLIKHKWCTWHSHSNLYNEDEDAEARKECIKMMDQVVKDASMTWRERGWWVNKAGMAFCTQCVREDREERKGKPASARDGTNPAFAPWLVKEAVRQDQTGDQAGVFETSVGGEAMRRANTLIGSL